MVSRAVGEVLRVSEAVAEGGGGEGLAKFVEDLRQLKRLVFGRWRLDEAIR